MTDDHSGLYNLLIGLIVVFAIIIAISLAGAFLFLPVAHSGSGGGGIILKKPFQKLI